jgi:hypothetical protein
MTTPKPAPIPFRERRSEYFRDYRRRNAERLNANKRDRYAADPAFRAMVTARNVAWAAAQPPEWHKRKAESVKAKRKADHDELRARRAADVAEAAASHNATAPMTKRGNRRVRDSLTV